MHRERYETPRSSNSGDDDTLLHNHARDLEASEDPSGPHRDPQDDQEMGQFQDYYDIVNSQGPSRRGDEAERATPMVSIRDRGHAEGTQGDHELVLAGSVSPERPNTPHKVRIQVQRTGRSARKPRPNYMRPIQKNIIQKEIEQAEKEKEKAESGRGPDENWNDRFWLPVSASRTGMRPEESPTAKPLRKSRKYDSVKPKIETTRTTKPRPPLTGSVLQPRPDGRYTSKDKMKKIMHQVASAQALIQRARAQTANIKQPEVTPVTPALDQSPAFSKSDKKEQAASGIASPPSSHKKTKSEDKKEKVGRQTRKRASTPGLERKDRRSHKKKTPPEQAEKKDAEEGKKPSRRNSQTFEASDLEVEFAAAPEKGKEEAPGPLQQPEQEKGSAPAKRVTDFIQKNKKMNQKEQKAQKSGTSINDRLKINSSAKATRKTTTQIKSSGHRVTQDQPAEITTAEEPEQQKERPETRVKSSKTIQLEKQKTPKGNPLKERGGQPTPSAIAKISEASPLLQPTISKKQKERNADRASSVASGGSFRSSTSLRTRSRPADDGSIKSAGSNDSSPATQAPERSSSRLLEKSGQPTARFLSPFQRDRVFTNSSTEQIQRATGIVVRPSRLKQKVQGKRRSAFNRFLLLDVDNLLLRVICSYLRGPRTGLPGLEIWRLSLASKMHFSIVSSIYDMQTLVSNQSTEGFLEMLSQKPQLTKFLGGQEHLQSLKQMCKSYVFGGSVLEAIRSIPRPRAKNAAESQGQTAKANNLLSQIRSGASGHNKYLILRNVLVDDYKFADIYILLTECSSASSAEKIAIEQMQNWHNFTKRAAREVKKATLRKINEEIRMAEEQENVSQAKEEPEDEKNEKKDGGSTPNDEEAKGEETPKKSFVSVEHERQYKQQIQEKKRRYESPYRFVGGQSKEPKKIEKRNLLEFKDIQSALTGYGRIIVYEYIQKQAADGAIMSAEALNERVREQDFQGIDGYNFRVLSMLEGQIKNGLLADYARVFDAEARLCSVGYWKPLSTQDQAKYCKDDKFVLTRSVPWGQWAQYNVDGQFRKGFEEGIYMGRSKRNPEGFKKIKAGGVDTYAQRIEPEMTFWTWAADSCCGL